ncbi:uncharacterized protein LOC6580624 [Drosophila mojavensis]|uniref:PDZ domain-containing protein n=1 Tax=Drosophila mojavensis TaxID=7230 RepID=B4KR25_DROMO|nr:uncharacterized protein LOC6580624 [Drosophila mojavensis]EDW10381.2 uncharacterized protein Dmoj_GI21050 [Drosophila mojavensis]
MDTGSVVSEPISAHHRAFAKQKSASMTILNPKSCASAAKYSLHAASENNHETQLHLSSASSHCSTTGRRRKGGSLGGTLSSRSTRSESKELRSALQDREAVIQNLRIQLCLGKLPRPSGPPLDESEKPAAEHKLNRLKAEAENKRIKIKNLKSALEKLDITDNIDIRIRQAELEYALGREELQMLSIVEEARALQARLEKSKPEAQTLYNIISSGVTLSLHAVHATTGRWAAQQRPDQPGFFVEWALEGDGLYKGDRILEINGRLVTSKTKEELQKHVGNSGKCQMVVLRKKSVPIPQKQLDQEKENNMRLQHRISYLEEQVRELQTVKEQQQQQQLQSQQSKQQLSTQSNNAHVTSISISSPASPSTPPDKPLIFQRGNYITTLVGGKPIELVGDEMLPPSHVTKTLIKENTHIDLRERLPQSHLYTMPSKSLSASKISINSDSAYMQQPQKREKERQRERHERNRERERPRDALQQQQQLHREHIMSTHARSVEHLNQYNGLERRRDTPRQHEAQTLRPTRLPSDVRSVKSLDFDSENESKPSTGSRAVHRPTPPKKPLRLSLQRAQSLQTVELNPSSEHVDRKRPMKRVHHNSSASGGSSPSEESQSQSQVQGQAATLIENCSPMHTASLGRHKLI